MKDKVELIRKEIERRINKLNKPFYTPDTPCGIALQTYKEMLSFIDSLPEERPVPISPADVGFEALGKAWDEKARRELEDEELKKEIKVFLDKTGAPFYWAGDEEQLEWLEIIAKHFANWKKRLMAKEAINGEVFDSYDKDICQHHLELLVDIPKQYKDGDKVKLIIIKEE